MLDYHGACKEIIAAAAKAERGQMIHYAAAYAQAGLHMQGEERRVQVLYILSNLTHWRHPKAKEVREALRRG